MYEMPLSSATPGSSSSSLRSKHLLEQAPKVPFGTDLLHWGEKIEVPLVVRYYKRF